jgi:hypothetical protein
LSRNDCYVIGDKPRNRLIKWYDDVERMETERKMAKRCVALITTNRKRGGIETSQKWNRY